MWTHSAYWRIVREMGNFVGEIKSSKRGKEVSENALHVAPHISITEFPVQFVTCWSYINGITPEPYELNDTGDVTLPEILRVLELSERSAHAPIALHKVECFRLTLVLVLKQIVPIMLKKLHVSGSIWM